VKLLVEGSVILVRLLVEYLVELSTGVHFWLFILWRKSFDGYGQSLYRVV